MKTVAPLFGALNSAISAYTRLADLAMEFCLALSPRIFKVEAEAECAESNR